MITTPTITTTINPLQKLLDAKNEQEFPSLGNAPINIRPTVALNMRPSTSGLARTKENFPALGGSGSLIREPIRPPSSAPSASKILFKTPAKPTIAIASSKNNGSNKAKSAPIKPHDFPALPGSSISNRFNLENDMIETPLTFHPSIVSSKHKGIVPSYEGISAANAVANHKIKTIQQVETKAQTVSQDQVPSIKSKENFPALGGSSLSSAAPQWLNGTSGSSKKQTQISKKLKVAPAPILPTSKTYENNKKEEKSKEKKKDLNKTENSTKKNEKDKSKKSDDNIKKTKENNDKNGNKNDKKLNENNSTLKSQQNNGATSNGTTNLYSAVANFTMPPPGFPAKKNEKGANVPPGFEKLTKSSKANSYMSPSNALQRNQVSNLIINIKSNLIASLLYYFFFLSKILVSHFMKSLKAPAVDEFRNISKLFRSGLCNSRSYYEHCEAVLGDRFESIFPELLALLPDITKQQVKRYIFQLKLYHLRFS